MKKIFVTMMTGLFLMSGIGLTAQPRGNGNNNGARQQLRIYMNNTIKPELLKQKKMFMNALTKTETEELLKMKEEQEAIRGSMQEKVTPENRDNIQKAHFSAFKPRLDKIVDAHPDLKKQYIAEMNQNKEKWSKEIKNMLPDNNNAERGHGPLKMLDRITDPAFILLWNPEHQHGNQRMKQGYGKKGQMGMNHPQMDRGMQRGMDNRMRPPKDMEMEPGIHIFPQPATSTTIVKISGVLDKNVEATVYNAKGKKVKELYNGIATMPRLDYTFDVSKWDAGIYTVKVTFDKKSMTMDFEVGK